MPLDRYANNEQVLSKSPTYGEVWAAADLVNISAGAVELELQPQDVNGDGLQGFTNPKMEYHVYSGLELISSNTNNAFRINVPGSGQSPALIVTPEMI